MKIVLMIFAGLVIAMGLLWTGQGSGLVNWPASSFMVGEHRWTWWGIALAIIGVVIFMRALRR
jgi:hypothetical protein